MIVKRLNSWDKLKQVNLPLFSPFQTIWWQQVFVKHFSELKDVYLLVVEDNKKLLCQTSFEKIGNKVVWLGMKPVLGKEEITDYGDILFQKGLTLMKKVEAVKKLLIYLTEKGIKTIQLDYICHNSQLLTVLKKIKEYKVQFEQEATAPFIKLPGNWDQYLRGLDRKKRKELKRKIRRLEETNSFHFCQSDTMREDFAEFVRLHRLSDLNKKKFMSKPMEYFFWHIISITKQVWQTRLCMMQIDGKNVASVLSFVSEQQILLYNSGYDSRYKYYSTGLLLQAFLIKQAIKEKLITYDFLRGGERYKYDLGARDLPLLQAVIQL